MFWISNPYRRLSSGSQHFPVQTWESRTRRSTCCWVRATRAADVASHESTSLTSSTAFTAQWKTCYTFYTSAGATVFFDEFERRLDALLHPDYTDEEIRREVRNFAVAENPSDRSLRLEEKGSVYNEMVTSMDQPGRRLYYAGLTMIYGTQHPLSWVSGGTPEGIRLMQPSDIRKFHAEHYHLANMGAIVSVPKEISLTSVLSNMDTTLNKVQPQRSRQPVMAGKGSSKAEGCPCRRDPLRCISQSQRAATRTSPHHLARRARFRHSRAQPV
jgi:hypothetical protein